MVVCDNSWKLTYKLVIIYIYKYKVFISGDKGQIHISYIITGTFIIESIKVCRYAIDNLKIEIVLFSLFYLYTCVFSNLIILAKYPQNNVKQ
jgi:hypothetical protein